MSARHRSLGRSDRRFACPRLVGLAGVVVLSGCDLSFEDQRAIDAWLGCVECVDGELERVDSLASEHPGEVVEYLAAALHGPSADRRANMAQQFAESWQRIAGSAAGAVVSERQYIDGHVANYAAAAQARAARALAGIATTEALRELQQGAANRGLRPDVRSYVASLVALQSLGPSGARLVRTTVDFGDTIRVIAPGGGFSGTESVRFAGQPSGVDLVLQRWGGDSLAIEALALPGRYVAIIEEPGSPAPRRIAREVTIQRVRYDFRPFADADTLVDGRVAFAPLSGWLDLRTGLPEEGSAVKRYRVVGDETFGHATVEWDGAASLAATWIPNCSAALNRDTARLSGNVTNELGSPIPGAAVELGQPPGTTVLTDEDGWFTLSGLAALSGDSVILRTSLEGGPPAVHRAKVGANELLIVHETTTVDPARSSFADTTATYFDEEQCKALRIVSPDRPGNAVLARTVVRFDPATIGSLVPDEAALALRVGRSQPLGATVLDDTGNVRPRHVVHWYSSDPAVVTVTRTGSVTGVSVGSARIVLAAGQRRAVVSIDVVP